MGVNSLHAGGVYVRTPTVCAQPFLQHAFQTADRVGREDIAEAIAQAEADIEGQLKHRLLPSWEVDEWRPTVRPWRPELFNLSITDLRGLGQVAQADWGYLVSGGVRAQTLVAAAQAIVYSDEDGDGYNETATITFATTLTDECELAVFYPVGDVVEVAGDEAWQVRPISATITAGSATIKMRREQLVRSELLERIVPPADDSHLRGVDGTLAANFLTTVDVYRIYNDPQLQVQFLWEPLGCTGCGGSGCPICSYASQNGCLMLRGNPRNSIVVYHPADWNSATLAFDATSWVEGRQPDLVRLWYYAGWRAKDLPCPTLQMDRGLERAVAYYAAALLDRPICGCSNVNDYVKQWQRDLSITGEEGMRTPERDLMNPFGTTRGAIFAWKRVDNQRIGEVAMT